MLETKRLQELALAGLRLELRRIDSEIDAIEALQAHLNTPQPMMMPPPMIPVRVTKPFKVKTIKPVVAKPRTLSPEGRKRLSLLAKKRWKAARRAGKAHLT